jgi:hypothetical protein
LAAVRSSEAVVPDSFTHGSSAQRQRWFNNGSVKACDTFSTKKFIKKRLFAQMMHRLIAM